MSDKFPHRPFALALGGRGVCWAEASYRQLYGSPMVSPLVWNRIVPLSYAAHGTHSNVKSWTDAVRR